MSNPTPSIRKKVRLIPPDKKRCQTEKPNGATFMTIGDYPRLIRCTNKPRIIIKEKKPPRGSMSVCQECFLKAVERFGDSIQVIPL